jgi:hypothetical protein
MYIPTNDEQKKVLPSYIKDIKCYFYSKYDFVDRAALLAEKDEGIFNFFYLFHKSFTVRLFIIKSFNESLF